MKADDISVSQQTFRGGTKDIPSTLSSAKYCASSKSKEIIFIRMK